MPWITEVTIVCPPSNSSLDSDFDFDFSAFPSLKAIELEHVKEIKLLEWKASQVSRSSQKMKTPKHFSTALERRSMKVQAKENYLRQNKTVSERFQCTGAQVQALAQFFLACEDGIHGQEYRIDT